MKNNHRTIFTQLIAHGETIDAPTARLIQFWNCAPPYEKIVNDQVGSSDDGSGVSVSHYAYILMIKACMILILEAVSRMPQYYSKEFYQELSAFSPIPFNVLKRIDIENKLMTVVENQWF